MESVITQPDKIGGTRAFASYIPGWRKLGQALEHRPFLRNVSIMLTGTTGGQLISILLAPVLTRLYGPEQFGVLSVYLALVSILAVMAAMRYELTIPLANDDDEAINLVAVCACALALTTLGVTVVAFLFPEGILEAIWPTPLHQPQLLIYRCLLPIGFFCLGAYYIALYLATRTGAFHLIALSRFAQGVVGPVTQIGMALLGAGAPGLLAGSILGQSAGTFGLLGRILSSRARIFEAVSWRRMATLARRYSRFPLIASWTALLDAAGGNQLLYILIAIQYSTTIAGFIFLIERVVARPLAMVGTSILQVYVGEAGRTATLAPDRLKSRFRQVIKHQFFLATFWIVVANIGAALFFPAVFGHEWSEAVVYLQAMSLGYLVQATVQPVFHTLQLLEKQGTAAAWQISRVIITVAIFALGAHLDIAPERVVLGYSVAQALCCGILLILMARAINKLQRTSP